MRRPRAQRTDDRNVRVAWIVAVLMLGGCSGSDPAEPRPAREVEPAGTVPERVPDEWERGAPTRGLACSVQRGSMRLCGASTDNYKASFNARPDEPERRTWLAIDELELDGRRYRVAEGQPLQAEAVRLVPVDGRGDAVEVVLELLEGPATVALRVGPQLGLWGPLLTLERDQVPEDAEIVVELRVRGGTDDASVRLEYVRDEDLAEVPADSLEHGGPGGRWLVDGTPTATNLELGWE